ncbi:MAG: ATP-dependent 6-phosphofructokinase [Geobacteraceae bacterium]|jgi:6-phosphofructokinase 1|nr:ATP-dependent 6-phosphofructokinase [Geobacteraceae bacterium]
MAELDLDFTISRLGECRIPSPMAGIRFVTDTERILYDSQASQILKCHDEGRVFPSIELAGPRELIYFDPSKLKCGIVTCGGICPGVNVVIRSLVMSLFYHYGVRSVFGFPYGFEGLSYRYGHTPLELDPQKVNHIQGMGGTILGSSRGGQDVPEMVDTLERMNIGVLFAIGGDGTLKGAGAIAEEIGRRGLKISIIGIPKTIDNDISFIQKSFGFETAVTEASRITNSAHNEATGARNGVGLVKLMGRESGFIAAYSVLSDNNVNFCLVPEVPFSIEGFIAALRDRLDRRGHAVIVVAEGAGQELMQKTHERDASGNIRPGDIGLFLKDAITRHFRELGLPLNLKYIDPSYTIRSVPATPHDSAFCLLLGHNAVHAAMTGRTNMVVGYWKGEFTHVPISLAASDRKKIDPEGWLWSSVLASTGQPRDML